MECTEAQSQPLLRVGLGIGRNRTVIAAAVLASGAAFHLVGILVLVRRIGGAVDRPAPVPLLLTAAAVLGVYAWLSRRLWREAVSPRDAEGGSRVLDVVVGITPSMAMVLLTLGLSLPLDQTFARYVDWLVWTPLWVADVLWRKSFFAGEPLQEADPNVAAANADIEGSKDNAVFENVPDEGHGVTLQQLTRVRLATDGEAITGTLRAEFAPSQRTAEVYLAFCPSFAGPPVVEVEQSDGPSARVGVGQVLPHGARIEVRLNEPATEASHVELEIFASGASHP